MANTEQFFQRGGFTRRFGDQFCKEVRYDAIRRVVGDYRFQISQGQDLCRPFQELCAVKLSVLDQSFSRSYNSAPDALQETIAMARLCEELKYERFWVSEHHAFHALAGSAPEVLIAALGAATSTIRLGSGGVMLPHYSAYKVAEQFSLLANLYPGRIDLGIGRAPGTEMSTAVALSPDGKPRFHVFPQQVEDLSRFLWSDDAKPMVSPKPPRDLPIWMLGTSADSAALAAARGLPYNLGAFINPTVDSSLIKAYKTKFQPSQLQAEPYATLAISVFCAETEEQARAQQRAFDINYIRFVSGQAQTGFLAPEEALACPISDSMQVFMDQRDVSRAVGTPEQVADKVTQIAAEFEADEIMAVTNMYYFEDRKTSFRLLKEAF